MKLNKKGYIKDKAKSQNIILYHVSPIKLGRILPVSKLKGTKGIYMSKSFKSIIIDWAPYVAGKKCELHPLQKQIHDLNSKIDELEKKIETIETSEEHQDVKGLQKLKAELETVDAKLEKILPSFNSEKYIASRKNYQTLYVHVVQCKKSIYKESLRRFIAAYKKDLENHKDDASLIFSFWNWGDQIFIPQEYVDQLTILDVKTYSQGDFQKAYHDLMLNRHLDNPSQLFFKSLKRSTKTSQQTKQTKQSNKF